MDSRRAVSLADEHIQNCILSFLIYASLFPPKMQEQKETKMLNTSQNPEKHYTKVNRVVEND